MALAFASDSLLELLGEADDMLAEFVVELASQARTPAALLRSLEENGVPGGAAATEFAVQLFALVPRRQGGAGAGGAARPSNAELLRSSHAYALVEEEVPRAVSAPMPPAPAPTQTDTGGRAAVGSLRAAAVAPAQPDAGEARRRHTRKRVGEEVGGEGEDDGVLRAARAAPKRARAWELEEEDEGGQRHGPSDVLCVQGSRQEAAAAVETAEERAERERVLDQEERRDFESRLAGREKEKKGGKGGGGEATLTDLLALPDEEREAALTDIRKLSRRSYLAKREARELALLAERVRMDEEVFGLATLSAGERKAYDLNKRILELAAVGKALEEEGGGVEDVTRYHMPHAGVLEDEEGVRRRLGRAGDALTARYAEPVSGDGGPPKSEHALWEEAQLAAGVRAAAGAGGAGGDGYELVYENAIDFVAGEIAKGSTLDDVLAGETAKAAREEAAAREAAEKAKAVAGGGGLTEAAREREKLAAVRRSLPMFPYRDDLLAAIKEHQVLIVVGETGSGKTTQLPQYLHEVGYTRAGKVGCTQPRRVAAMSVAARVATEMGVKLGGEVGYSIRFEDCTSDKTVIKYMTDGMLLREFLAEPDLAGYSAMIIDEAHERTLHTDVLLGLLKDLARFRPDLKLIISSATVDSEKFSRYFDDAPIYNIPGRRFPVVHYHTKAPEADFVEACVMATLQIHVTQPVPGDILVFLTGQEEIEAAAESLTTRTRGLGTKIKELIICPVYAALPAEQQAKIFDATPSGARKVILATNIAETSLTIEGIVYVVDCGFVKQNGFNPRTGMESLQIVPISKASAKQRSGRAGRTGPGKCFRLYTEWAYTHELPDSTTPEILRTNLSNVVLLLKSLGIHDLVHFDFMDPPPAEALIKALEQLYALGALNDKGELTKTGRRMAEFPCDPQLSKMILASEKYGCADEAISVAAMLDVGSAVFYRPKERALLADTARMNFARGANGDHSTLLAVFNGWRDAGYSAPWCHESFVQAKSMKRARDIREQLATLCERVEIPLTSCGGDADALGKAITAGFFYNVARLERSGAYRTVKTGHSVHIHPSSVLAPRKEEVPPKWLLFHELVETSKEFMRTCSGVRPEWLTELAPHVYSAADIAEEVRKMPKGAGKAAVSGPDAAGGGQADVA
jgi:pre-mRNA-splicing factor ATP-dependent RNA helicase DHX16